MFIFVWQFPATKFFRLYLLLKLLRIFYPSKSNTRYPYYSGIRRLDVRLVSLHRVKIFVYFRQFPAIRFFRLCLRLTCWHEWNCIPYITLFCIYIFSLKFNMNIIFVKNNFYWQNMHIVFINKETIIVTFSLIYFELLFVISITV